MFKLCFFGGMQGELPEQSFSELSSTSLVRINTEPVSGIKISVNIKRIERCSWPGWSLFRGEAPDTDRRG